MLGPLHLDAADPRDWHPKSPPNVSSYYYYYYYHKNNFQNHAHHLSSHGLAQSSI